MINKQGWLRVAGCLLAVVGHLFFSSLALFAGPKDRAFMFEHEIVGYLPSSYGGHSIDQIAAMDVNDTGTWAAVVGYGVSPHANIGESGFELVTAQGVHDFDRIGTAPTVTAGGQVYIGGERTVTQEDSTVLQRGIFRSNGAFVVDSGSRFSGAAVTPGGQVYWRSGHHLYEGESEQPTAIFDGPLSNPVTSSNGRMAYSVGSQMYVDHMPVSQDAKVDANTWAAPGYGRPAVNDQGKWVTKGSYQETSDYWHTAIVTDDRELAFLSGVLVQGLTQMRIGGVDSPDINNSNDVTFWARGAKQDSSTEIQSILIKPDIVTNNAQLQRVVASNDQVEGRTVSDVGRPAIDNHGQIWYGATFTDGAAAVVKSTNLGRAQKRLVLVAHGWNDQASNWADAMADNIYDHLDDVHGQDTNTRLNKFTGNDRWSEYTRDISDDVVDEDDAFMNDWDVVSFDWQNGADTSLLTLTQNARRAGQRIGRYIAEYGYDSVHLIGHSAGSWVIDEIADAIDRANDMDPDAAFDTQMHLTFLDAYVPWSHGELGDAANGPNDFAEHYVHKGRTPATNHSRMLNLHTLDITGWDPTPESDDPLFEAFSNHSGHGFPVQWYMGTTAAPGSGSSVVDGVAVPTAGWGFARSLEYADTLPSHSLYPKYQQTILAAGKHADPEDDYRQIQGLGNGGYLVRYGEAQTVGYGTLDVHPVSQSVTLGLGNSSGPGGGLLFDDPIMPLDPQQLMLDAMEGNYLNSATFYIPVTLNRTSNAMQFRYWYGMWSGDTDLNIYFEDQLIYIGTENPDTVTTDWLWLGDYFAAGEYMMRIEIGSTSGEQATIMLYDMEFGTTTPTPTALAGLLGLGLCLASRRKNQRP